MYRCDEKHKIRKHYPGSLKLFTFSQQLLKSESNFYHISALLGTVSDELSVSEQSQVTSTIVSKQPKLRWRGWRVRGLFFFGNKYDVEFRNPHTVF